MKHGKKISLLCMTFLLAAICLLVLPTQAEAAVVETGSCGNNVTYTLDDAGTLTISGTGSIDKSAFIQSDIKEVIIETGVTTIGDCAFYGCNSLIDVTIPDSVTTIGERAFGHCASLTGIWVDENNPEYSNDSFGVLFRWNGVALAQAPGALAGDYIIQDSVSRIFSHAFVDCDSLTSITIPSSVTLIEENAFYDCDRLEGIRVDENNPGYSSDSFGVFFNKSKTKLIYAPDTLAGEYAIPDSVTNIAGGAFGNCRNLTSVTIPEGITTIGGFYGCNSLTSVVIPKGVKGINATAFMGCTSLREVIIPEGVEYIGSEAFRECTSLTDVTIPDSVTTIGLCAFYDCTSLTSVTIGDNVTTIEYAAFDFCTSLTDVYYIGTEAQWNAITVDNGNDDLLNANIHFESIKPAAYNAMDNTSISAKFAEGTTQTFCPACGKKVEWTALTAISANRTLEDGKHYYLTEDLSNTATYNVPGGTKDGEVINYTNVTIHLNGHNIRSTKVVINTGVRSNLYIMGEGTVSGGGTTGNAATLTLTGNAYLIGGTYTHTGSLPTVTLLRAAKALNLYSGAEFIATPGASGSHINVPYGTFNMYGGSVSGGTAVAGDKTDGKGANVAIAVNTINTTVAQYHFNMYGGTIDGGVYVAKVTASTNDYDFTISGDSVITAKDGGLTIEKGKLLTVGELGENASIAVTATGVFTTALTDAEAAVSHFLAAEQDNSITAKDSVLSCGNAFGIIETEKCGENATYALNDTGTLTISGTGPMYDYTWNGSPFDYRYDIKEVIIETGITTIDDSVFCSCTSLTSVIIPDSVTTIGDSAFLGCYSLTGIWVSENNPNYSSDQYGVLFNKDKTTLIQAPGGITGAYTIPDSVTTIGSSAFYGCNSLEEVTIGDSVTTIGDSAFIGCFSLTNVTIGNSVTTMGDSVFYNCDSLTSVTIPDSVTTIGDSAFYSCKRLREVTIGDSVTTIGDDMFCYCTSLKKVIIGDSVTTIGEDAFWGCDSLTSVTIGDSVTTIGDSAFCNCTSLTSVIIPDSITTIGRYAFHDCDSLTNVTISDSVTTIEDSAFYDCNSLTNVYYAGTQTQWSEVTIESNNDALRNADYIFDELYTKGGNTYYGVNGKNFTGWKTISGKTYYFKVGTGGTMAKSWTTIGGKKYYFIQADGSMVTGVVKIGGIPNEFAADGVWIREIPAPKITKQPVSVKVAAKQTAATTITVTGEGLTYTWYVQNPGTTTWVKSSITKSTYSYAMEASKSGRKVYCVITDKYGQTVTTNTVTLSMAAAPKITKQPVSTKAANGKNLTVSFTASGEGLTYKWYYKDKGASAFTYTSSFKTNAYTTVMTAARDGRQIYCVITDKYGNTVQTNTVTISMASAPKITKQPVSVKVANNKSLTVSFTASGEGLTYKWYYKDKGASAFTYTSSFKTNAYTTTMTSARNGRQLYCVVTDKYGQTVKTNTVTISMAAAPKITKQPVSTKAANGKSLTVSFTASGEGLTYKWYYKNKGASAFTYTSTFKSNTYTTTMDATRNGRQLYCVVTDKYGQTVKTVTVTISMAAAPKITKQPVSVKVANGATAKVTFTASGEGLTYKWYYKDKGQTKFTLTNSFKTNTYSVAMTAARSGRQLYCVVTDKYGQTVKTNTVTISMK